MTDADGRSRPYYVLVAAVAGAVVLGLEVLAARTLAPAVGSGSVVWSVLLSVALGALAAGNLLGGWLADRGRAAAAVPWALVIAAAALLAASQGYPVAMHWSAPHPLLVAALLAAVATQFVPMFMLGGVTPLILRAGAAETARGRWAGAVLAAGSGGGIVGALSVGLWLLPAVGLSRTYIGAGGVLVIAAVPAICRARRWFCAALAVACLTAAACGWLRGAPRSVIQSAYGQVEVRTIGEARVLLVDGLPQTGLVGVLAPWEALQYGYLLEAALSLRPAPRDALVIGLGAGLAPRVLAAHGVPCESVELDPVVVAVARREFAFEGTVTVADGRSFLEHAARQWDLIVLDVCTDERLPYHLFTVEALQTLRRRLAPGGLAAIQFIGDDGAFAARLADTVRAVFAEQTLLAAPGSGAIGPRWLLASDAPLPPLAALLPGDAPQIWQVLEARAGHAPMTDDHFGAEWDWARSAAAWRRELGRP